MCRQTQATLICGSGADVVKVAVALASVLYSLPMLLPPIINGHCSRSQVHRSYAKLLGPQILAVLQEPCWRPLWKKMIRDALGPIAHTAVAVIAATALELALMPIAAPEEHSMDDIRSALGRIGRREAEACSCLVFPPVAYVCMLQSAAHWVLGPEADIWRGKICPAIVAAVGFLRSRLHIQMTATGTATMFAYGQLAVGEWMLVGGGILMVGAAGAGGMTVAAVAVVAAGAAVMICGAAYLGYKAYKHSTKPTNVSQALMQKGLIS